MRANPSKSMSEWLVDKELKGWTWGIVDVPVEQYFGLATKINITVPALILKRIDRYGKKTAVRDRDFW